MTPTILAQKPAVISNTAILIHIKGLVCYWDFEGQIPLQSKGNHQYTLLEGNSTVKITSNESPFARHAAAIEEGQYFYIPRKDCPALNIHGRQQVTVLAWVQRKPKSYVQCEAIAGMWNETLAQRQYCLFLNLRLFDSANQVCGHVSGVGGPTSGQQWCIDASIGQSEISYNNWHFVAFTYDGRQIASYIDGRLDTRNGHNPYPYHQGIFDGGETGSDFTIGAVHRLGEMGNYFVGKIAGIGVFCRALQAIEIETIHNQFPLNNHGKDLKQH